MKTTVLDSRLAQRDPLVWNGGHHVVTPAVHDDRKDCITPPRDWVSPLTCEAGIFLPVDAAIRCLLKNLEERMKDKPQALCAFKQ